MQNKINIKKEKIIMGWNDVERVNGEEKEKIPYTKFEGSTVIRVIDKEPYSFWSHWLPKQNTGVTCPGKGCPICSVMAEQRASNLPKTYNSTQRHAVRIWNYDTNQMEIMIQGKTFFSQLLTFHREIGDLTGYDLKVIRKGSGKDTTYTLIPQPAKDCDFGDKIVDVDYAELFKAPDTETIVQLMEGKTWDEINGANEA